MEFILLSITLQYPVWYLVFCILIGVLLSAILYYKFDQFPNQPSWLVKTLAVLRFITGTILAILLLSPIIKSKVTDVKKPVIIVAQDASESIGIDLNKEASSTYQKNMNELVKSLQGKYEVKTFSFGENVREGMSFDFKDKSSNLSAVINDVSDIYGNQNLGAIIMATDGIYNQGSNPSYTSARLVAPIYTIALGDTVPKKDLVLKRVFSNNIAYLGDKFALQVDIAARNCDGKSTQMEVTKIESKKSSVLDKRLVAIDKKDFFKTQEIILNADNVGVQHYRISLSPVDGEITRVNNTKDVYIEVIDARLKVLILAAAPHPDISAIKQTLSDNKNFVLETALMSDLKVKPESYDLVILHQLPTKNYDITGIISKLDAKNIPRMFILGSQTDPQKFNKVQPALSINGDGRNWNDVQGIALPDFSLFTLDPSVGSQINQFPPLTVPFGDYKITGNAKVLLNQQIGKIETKYPLMLFSEFNNIKTGILAGEGLWRWRMFDYLQRHNHDAFNQVLQKSIQYLSVKEDKRKFRVVLPKNVYLENEQIVFDAELYNNSYELVNEPDVNMVIRNENNKDFTFTFSKTGRYYTLNAGFFPVGTYTFKATTNYSGNLLSYTGKFEVQPVQLELYETTANHSILRTLSQNSGGKMVNRDQIASLAEIIKAKETIKPVMYQTNSTKPVVFYKLIFFLLLTFLGAEWFMRRYYGSY